MRGATSKVALYDAAIDMLAANGAGRLKVTTLCRHAGVTTGAFYHYFDGWESFKLEFLDYWSAHLTEHFAQLAQEEPDPEARLGLLVDFACALPHRAEAAIRSWSVSDDDVARSLTVVDDMRLAIATDVLVGVFEDRERAERVAAFALCFLTGYQHLAPRRDIDFLRESLLDIVANVGASSDR
ncbi:TetR/AcrR family transcriptional regulator [Rhodococcus sp. NPDC060086]|uniref:TetR/AcrR family transcriptional regulator n=1 Tax=Rhodococcus sp. NPDC060086 TaxID=3347055 RepID=UPI00364A0F8E